MITKFLQQSIKGASAEYSLGYLEEGYDCRDPMVLIGNEDAFLEFHQRYNLFSQGYSSAVVSCREAIDDDEARELAGSFVECVLPGAKPGQFAVLAVRHREASRDYAHRTAVHFHFGHTNLLLTDQIKRVQPNWSSLDGRRIHAWTDTQNLLRGLTSPSDPQTSCRIGVRTWPNNLDAYSIIKPLSNDLLEAYEHGANEAELRKEILKDPVKGLDVKVDRHGVFHAQFSLFNVKCALRLMPPAYSRWAENSQILDVVDPQRGLERTSSQLGALWRVYSEETMKAAQRLHDQHGASLEIAQEQLARMQAQVERTMIAGVPPLRIRQVTEVDFKLRPIAPPNTETGHSAAGSTQAESPRPKLPQEFKPGTPLTLEPGA